MVGPVILLIQLWWCTHIDSWHVVSWLAYISDLEFWSAFVWSIILVLLCQYSFGDVWSCFSIGSLRLCISFSLHHHEHIPEYLVRWHSVSHVDYYLTLGHTPILEFVGSFAVFLTTRSISWSLRVVILGHTLLALDLGHSPLFGFAMSRANFMIVRRICRSLWVIT